MPIKFEKVSHIYSDGTPFRYVALSDVDLDISEGKMTAIIGQTGSGKSTLVQHLNALLMPSSGCVSVLDRTIEANSQPKGLKSLRKDVGLVFQFPEYQLFEETVLSDVAFGPKNFGVSKEEAETRAKEALRMVGISKEYENRSPLELSGGQKRRVAIAGILAMNPRVLVLDEPTAGLDPQGAHEMMLLFSRLNREENKTVLIVTHDMELVFEFCDEVIVMENAKPKLHTSVEDFFKDEKLCKELNILPPAMIQMKERLREKGFEIDASVHSLQDLVACIESQVNRHG